MSEDLIQVICPYCDTDIHQTQMVGETIGYTCPNCDSKFKLEVSTLIPLEDMIMFENAFISLQE